MIFSIKPQIFELKCVFSYFRLKTHITLLLPVYVHSWEQRKLGEVAKYRNGKAHENCIDESGKYIVVNSKFVSTNGTVIKHSNMQNEPLAQNEIAFVLSDVPNGRAIARTFLVEENDKYTLNQRIAGITSSENTYPYFLHILMNRHPYFLAFDDGVKQTNLSVSDVLNFETYYPEYEEQKQIGEYFRNLDRLITLHQRKCQIDGCRFQSPLAITWEQRKLGEIGSVSMCRRIFKEQTSENGEIPFYKIGTFGGEADAFISRELFEEYKAKYQYPKKGDILISASGSIGRTVVFTGKNEYFQDSNIVWLNHDKHLDNSFLKCFYSIVKWAGIEGSTIKRLYNDNILNTAITLPSVEEQQKIGAYFENLDNLITLHQRKPVVVNSSSTMNALPNQHLYFQVLE